MKQPPHFRSFLGFLLGLAFASSGLAQLTIVEEAPYFTGTFITVRYASEKASPTNFLAVAPVNAAPENYLDWDYAKEREGEVRLRLPDTPQLVEVRLLETRAGQNPQLLAATELLEVISLTASLSAPTQVAPGETFEVVWEGPGGENDQILLATLGASLSQSLESQSVQGQVRFTAPQEPGFYELRYLMGETLLAMQTVEVMDSSLATSPDTATCEVGDEASLETTFEREASAFMADAYQTYGDQYSDVSYSYDTSTSISGNEGRVSAFYDATLVTKEGETLERSGTVEVVFTWSNCAWSLVDYSY